MDCPRCGAQNETEVGSCLSCGAPLTSEEVPTVMPKSAPAPAKGRLATPGAPPKQCPNCMTLNAATFKFCARCGTPLGATNAPQPPAPKAPAAAAPRPATVAPRPATPAAPRAPAPPAATATTRPAAARPAPPTPTE